MKKTIFPAIFLFFVVTVNAYCSPEVSATKETRDLRNFSEISFGISGHLTVRTGSDFSVVLEGARDDLERVITEVTGDKLVIRHENRFFNFGNYGDIDIYINMPGLKGLSVSGSGKAEVVNDIEHTDDLYLSVSGSGRIVTGNLYANEMDCSISGSGDMVIEGRGSVDKAEISISGSGTYSGRDVEIDNLRVSVSGSGDCHCRVTGFLTARISGSGNISYSGNPRIDSRSSGSGRLRSVD
ncbi:MAG TPA: head GIN domain-containing protein [Bacteroidales bacterium]|nr:head GIN domain-containing protein [Bacteroidales bacterium]HPR72717.1 head GIN domain-containing protein [Bacteroidales bacterium]